jgi:hypothetical protein
MLLQNMTCPEAAPGWPARPNSIAESVWVIAQEFISYGSDGLRVGTSSWAHVVDRSTTPLLFLLQMFKFCHVF